ncbi:MAG: EAL domain-containing protein [Chloroflexota bacterium]|nr:EAL domain-containing protein [Chloroflexota bacterium]
MNQFSQDMISNAQQGIVAYDREFRYLLWNPYMERVSGIAAEEVLGRVAPDLFPLLRNPNIQALWRQALTGETVQGPDAPFMESDSRQARWVAPTYAPHRDASGEIVGVLGILNDITERKKAEEGLRESEERYHELFENATDVVFTHDLNGKFTAINAAARRLSGYSQDEALQLNIDDVIAPEHLDMARGRILEKLQSGSRTTYDLDLLAKDGSRIPLELNTRLILRNDQPIGVQGIGRDIRDRKRFEETLRHQALHDALTDLPNRTLFDDRLHQAIITARRERSSLALLMMDLDRFKEVNDTFGHHYGNLLLQQIGPRLRQVVRQSDTIARMGGDEFAMLLPGATARGASVTARKIRQALAEPFVLEDQTADIDGSIGITLFPRHGDDAATLLLRADVAMYVAKRNHSDYAIYSPEQDENSPERLQLIAELRRAIDRDRLVLHYQPTVDLSSGRVNSVEALVRWPHAAHGLLQPEQFIPLAEQLGLIGPLSRWALKSALGEMQRWRQADLRLCVAVNLSSRDLHDVRLVNSIGRLLQTLTIDAPCLTVELTESAVMSDPEHSMKILTRLHDMGVRVAIDDFGTGYSSLSYLRRLPVDEIKIDRSFVIDLADTEDHALIVGAIVDLGHKLGMQVAAEGVEKLATLDLLRSMGCDKAQGYYLGRPMPADEVAEWVAAQQDRMSCEPAG